MKMSDIILCAMMVVSLVFFGCGGGGDEDAGTVGNLAGIWSGVLDDLQGTLEEFSVEIDGAGNVLGVRVGGVPTGNTGYINEDWDENLFHVRYTTSGMLQGGVMIVDSGYRYATFADNNLFIGVLEKGASSLPSYAASDIVWSYNGGAYEFTQDSGGTWNWEGEVITMTVDNSLSFSGSSSSGLLYSGAFDAQLYSPSFGRYAGSMDLDPARTLNITALVSPDKNFLAAYAKDMGTTPMNLDGYMLIGLLR